MTDQAPQGESLNPRLWLNSDEVPPGFWQRDLEHWRLPVTPITADLRIGTYGLFGQRLAREEFALLTPPANLKVIDGYVYRGSPSAQDTPSPERIAAYEERVRGSHDRVVLRRWQKEVRPSIVRRLQDFHTRDLTILTDGELTEHFSALDACLLEWYAAHYINNHARGFLLGRCMSFCREHLDLQGTDFLELLAGASPASSDPVTAMEELAAEGRRTPGMAEALNAADPWSQPLVWELFQPYLQAYGCRALELEYAVPTLEEQPHRLMQLLRDAMARLAAGQEGAVEKVRSQREATVQDLKRKLPDDAKEEFNRLLSDAQAAYGARDDEKGLLASTDGLMRYVLLEAGRRLAQRGLLTTAEQVFFLWRREMEECMSGHPLKGLAQRAEARSQEHRRHQAMQAPFSLGIRPDPPSRPSFSQDVREAIEASKLAFDPPRRSTELQEEYLGGQLHGQGASAGTYVGPARIVLTEAELDRVQPGDVLVCPATTTAWSLVFGKIGALVTDTGSILSHPAITAREFGIPAVVATRTATKVVRDGQMVRVDGKAGIVDL
jgi:phosphohistidine swiveling domain-containing protein